MQPKAQGLTPKSQGKSTPGERNSERQSGGEGIGVREKKEGSDLAHSAASRGAKPVRVLCSRASQQKKTGGETQRGGGRMKEKIGAYPRQAQRGETLRNSQGNEEKSKGKIKKQKCLLAYKLLGVEGEPLALGIVQKLESVFSGRGMTFAGCECTPDR